MTILSLTRTFHTVCGKAMEWGEKTVSHTAGLQKLTRVNISILKLAGAIFPHYKEMLTPVLDTLSGFRNICNSTLTITTLAKIVEARKITIGHLFQLMTSLSLTMHFLYSVEILPLNKAGKVASQTGSNANSSLLQAAWQLVSRNSRNTWIAVGSTFCLAGLFMGYYQAKNPEEKKQAASLDKCLLFANQTGKLFIIALGGCQAPIFLGYLDLAVSLASYARFLVLPRARL